VGGALVVALALVSVVRAAQIEAANVRYITDYQVNTAVWLRDNTPGGALVATHDVGAIGYFSRRPVLDMAGLIDPQVVPLLSDQPALERYLAAHRVRYVAMFTDWFPPPALLAHDLSGDEVHVSLSSEFAGSPDSIFKVYYTGW
jgi:hypothetical protein